MRDDQRTRLEELDEDELDDLLDFHANLDDAPGFDKPDYPAVAALVGHPGLAALEEEVRRQRERYMVRIGRTLTLSREPANQRMIDYNQGYYLGALWAVSRLPGALKKHAAKLAGEESEMEAPTFEDDQFEAMIKAGRSGP